MNHRDDRLWTPASGTEISSHRLLQYSGLAVLGIGALSACTGTESQP